MKRASAISLLAAVLSIGSAGAQALRTSVSAVISVSSASPEGVSVPLRYNQAVGITLTHDTVFIQGLEFELRIPKAMQGAEASIAWSLYSSVSPTPSVDKVEYVGELIATQPLPARVAMSLILPISERHALKGSPFAGLVPMIVGPERFPVFFKLTPIGKGLLSSMEAAEFRLTVRPVLRDEGGLRISLAFPEGSDPAAVVFVDDKRIEDHKGLIIARKGPRVIRVVAEGFREEVVTVPVEAGRIIPLELTMIPNLPRFAFEAPAGTIILLDGQAVPASEMGGLAVEPGEHTLFFRIGDYSMTRKILALRGKTYRLVLSVELDVQTAP